MSRILAVYCPKERPDNPYCCSYFCFCFESLRLLIAASLPRNVVLNVPLRYKAAVCRPREGNGRIISLQKNLLPPPLPSRRSPLQLATFLSVAMMLRYDPFSQIARENVDLSEPQSGSLSDRARLC